MYAPSPRKITMEDEEYLYELIDPSVTFSSGGFSGGYRVDAHCWSMNVIKKEDRPMLIYFIRYRDDDPADDGIWLFTDGEKQFYLTANGAEAACKIKNEEDRVIYDARKEKARVKWELDHVAYQALERAGIDASKTILYHKPIFDYQDYRPNYVVDQIEVQE